MDVIGTVAAFIAILVVLVLVHELGHFITAKRAGITVEEFGIGFPPRIASVTWHGTRYSLNWIPLGGFVRMLGEDGDVEIRRLREGGLTDARSSTPWPAPSTASRSGSGSACCWPAWR